MHLTLGVTRARETAASQSLALAPPSVVMLRRVASLKRLPDGGTERGDTTDRPDRRSDKTTADLMDSSLAPRWAHCGRRGGRGGGEGDFPIGFRCGGRGGGRQRSGQVG